MTATTTLEPGGSTATAGAGRGRRHAIVPTALGEVTLVAEGDTLVGVYYAEHRPEPDRSGFGEPADPAGDVTLGRAADQLLEYVSGTRLAFDLPLQPAGSERARRVWDLVAAVPRGETTSYAALGRAVGVGPRAAGQFVARNPLSVVVPCHRVVASDGRLTGYAGGVERKRLLLELEGALPAVPPGGPGPSEREQRVAERRVAPPAAAVADLAPEEASGPEAPGSKASSPGAAG